MRHLIPTLLAAALVAVGCNTERPVTGTPSDDAAKCSACHGSTESPAPPKDLLGNDDPTLRGVGAHQAHLNAKLSAPVACESCHVVPAKVEDHGDTWPAKVVFSGIATKDVKPLKIVNGVAKGNPQDDGALVVSCATTYCHGGTLHGGKATRPEWNAPLDARAAFKNCDSCHGYPPPAPHPQSATCSSCHDTVGPDNATIAKVEQHINGTVDVAGRTCTSCHGTAGANAAPPKDTKGNTATTEVTVGAHQSHLKDNEFAKAFDCAVCHVKPTTMDHATGQGAHVTFDGRANADSVTSSWDANAATCTTYCHGASLVGGSNTHPKWTKVDDTQATCGSCHGMPPVSASHPVPADGQTCASCHMETFKADGTTLDTAKHLDGQVEAHRCGDCHGGNPNDPNDPMPWADAHRAHVHADTMAPQLSTAISCTECHTAPYGAVGHNNGTVALTFGARANQDGVTTAYDATAHTCATYCHGESLPAKAKGTNTRPDWTRADGTQDACGTCHGMSPTTGKHPAASGSPHSSFGRNCTACHGFVSNGAGTAINDRTKHIDGQINIASDLTWNATNRTCSGSCHGTSVKTWGN